MRLLEHGPLWSDIVCAFMRHEVAMMFPAELLNQWYPHLSIGLKFLKLERIDQIAKRASNHSILPKGSTEDISFTEDFADRDQGFF